MEPKTLGKSKSIPNLRGGAITRGRDAEFPSAPVHVSKDALSRRNLKIASRPFELVPSSPSPLPDRPKTSGGPSKQKDFFQDHRALTRDDLHIAVKHPYNGTSFNFPVPTGPPTTDDTRSASPYLKPATSSQRESPGSPAGPDECLPIGTALGSPTHQPSPKARSFKSPVIKSKSQFETPQPQHKLHPQHQLQRQRSNQEFPKPSLEQDSTTSPEMPHHFTTSVSSTDTRQKSSKWKVFGLFGGKKTTTPVEQVSPYTFPVPPTPAGQDKTRMRGRTNSVKKGKITKEIKRSNTEPLSALGGQPTPRIQMNDSLMLNVDIPDIKMERYSVMFGSVLNQGASQPSSLLARRQANLERLKTPNEQSIAEAEEEEPSKYLRPRGISTPVVTKSPAHLSLFPSTPNNADLSHAVRKASPLHRSNTSPAALSPVRPSFDRVPEPARATPESTERSASPKSSESTETIKQQPSDHAQRSPIAPETTPKTVPSKAEIQAAIQNAGRGNETIQYPIELPARQLRHKIPEKDARRPEKTNGTFERTMDQPHAVSEQKPDYPAPLKSALKKPLQIDTSGEATSWLAVGSRLDLSPDSMSPSEGIIDIAARPSLFDPQWNMTRHPTRPAGNSVSSSSTERSASSGDAGYSATSQSSADSPTITAMSKLPPVPISRTSEDDYKREEAIRSAAEISIARQISVSHSQRRMLNLRNKKAAADTDSQSPEDPRVRNPSGQTLKDTVYVSPTSAEPQHPGALSINRPARENRHGDLSPLARSPSNVGNRSTPRFGSRPTPAQVPAAPSSTAATPKAGSVARARARAESAAAAMVAASSGASSPINHVASLTQNPYVTRPSQPGTVNSRLDPEAMARIGMKFGEARKGSISVVEQDPNYLIPPGAGGAAGGGKGLIYGHKHRKSERAVVEEA